MRFEEKLKKCSAEEIWEEYCGFLDLSMKEYMQIQERLLMEQVDLLSKCGLGKKLFGDKVPQTVEEYRRNVPITQYDYYADILLMKRANMLPAEPLIWLQTTWEGGTHPAKVAPYSAGMLETCKKNGLGAMIIAASHEKGRVRLHPKAKILYSLAPLPFVTGVIPDLIGSEIELRFLPSLKESANMSFSQKTKRGFELGARGGIDYFYGVSSILHGVSRNFDVKSSSGISSIFKMSPKQLMRLIVAKYRSKRDKKPILPKDIFKLESFVCAGTDSARYKDELEEIWGLRPVELAGGTESTCLGVETWSKNGLVFFPDACFYEFIPENEMMRSLKYPTYQPHTYCMDEVVANQNYELVVTVLKGGSFARYRMGDMYRCLRVKNKQDDLDIPQFEYIDRTPNIIDIAGFTRITEKEIATVIELSYLPIKDWFALKEYDEYNHSYLHLYIEASQDGSKAVTPAIVKEHMNVYFRYYDGDYKDLKKLLGVDPLKVTLIKTGTIKKYKDTYSVSIPKINPSRQEVIDMIRLNSDDPEGTVLACQ